MGDLWMVSPKRLEMPADTCLQLAGSFPQSTECQEESARRQTGSYMLVDEENGDVFTFCEFLERCLYGGDLCFC